MYDFFCCCSPEVVFNSKVEMAGRVTTNVPFLCLNMKTSEFKEGVFYLPHDLNPSLFYLYLHHALLLLTGFTYIIAFNKNIQRKHETSSLEPCCHVSCRLTKISKEPVACWNCDKSDKTRQSRDWDHTVGMLESLSVHSSLPVASTHSLPGPCSLVLDRAIQLDASTVLLKLVIKDWQNRLKKQLCELII